MKRLDNLKETAPETLSNPDITELAAEGDKLHDIKVLAQSDGGKTLVKLLSRDVIFSIQKLTGMYRTATRDEMVSVLASIEAQFNVARLLMTADETLKYLDAELEEALRE